MDPNMRPDGPTIAMSRIEHPALEIEFIPAHNVMRAAKGKLGTKANLNIGARFQGTGETAMPISNDAQPDFPKPGQVSGCRSTTGRVGGDALVLVAVPLDCRSDRPIVARR